MAKPIPSLPLAYLGPGGPTLYYPSSLLTSQPSSTLAGLVVHKDMLQPHAVLVPNQEPLHTSRPSIPPPSHLPEFMGSSVAGSQEQRREVGCQTDWQLPPEEEYIPVLVGGPGQGGHGGHGDPESSTQGLGPYTGDNSSEVMSLLGAGAVPNSDTESDFEQVQDRAKKDIMDELNFFCDDENNMDINAWNDFNFEDPLKYFDLNQLSEPSTKVKTVGEALEKKEMEIEANVNSLEANDQLEAKTDVDPQSTVEPSALCQPVEGETIENIADFICKSEKSRQAEESSANLTRGGRSYGATISISSPKSPLPVPVPTGVSVRRLATDSISISRLLPLYSLPKVPRAISKRPADGVTRNSQPIVISSSDSEEEAFFIKGLPRGKKNRSKKVAVSGGRECAGVRKTTGQKTSLPQRMAFPSPPGTVRRLLPASSQPGVSWGLRRPASTLPIEGCYSPLPCTSPQDIRASPLAGDLGSVGGVKRAGDGPGKVKGPKAKRSRGFRDLIE